MSGGEISEADFVGLLRSLGVETGGLSFGWMLNEYDTEGVLRWMYTNLDSRNALTRREACRYAELKEHGLISETELETAVLEILSEHPGLILPGDTEGLEIVKQENRNLREQLELLKKQERMLATLVKQNELVKEAVVHQISDLKEDQACALAELDVAKAQCLSAAETVTQREQDLFEAVARHLKIYIDYKPGEEAPKQFLLSGPLEVYNKKKRQFRTQLKMRAARQLDPRRWDKRDTASCKVDASAAKQAEKRLYDGIVGYVETLADYYHTHNVIQVMSSPMDVHPSRIATLMSETQSSLSLLRQQERLALDELRAAARELCRAQTRRHASKHADRALVHRREVYSIVSELHAAARTHDALDSLLYLALRREWRRAQDTAQFATDVRDHLKAERNSTAARKEAMMSLAQEHAAVEQRLRTDSSLLAALQQIYRDAPGESIEQKMELTRKRIEELREEVMDEFARKEQFLENMRESARPMHSLVWDTPTMQERSLARLQHKLRRQLSAVDDSLSRSVDMFTTVKAKDKDMARKMWQWFLADPDKLIDKIEQLRKLYSC